jgi:hypothetical protein
MASASFASAGGGSADNVNVCVRLRPVTTGESAWVIGSGGAQTLATTDVKGRVATSYGFGEWGVTPWRRKATRD